MISLPHLSSSGKYPVETVTIMSKICVEAEAAMFHSNVFDELRSLAPKPTPTVQTIAIASVDAAYQQNASAIITLTTTGTYVGGSAVLHLLFISSSRFLLLSLI